MSRYGDNEFDYPWIPPYSCIRAGDPVPNVPPTPWGYEDPEFLCDPSGQAVQFGRGLSLVHFASFNFRNFRLDFAPDHAMEAYLEDTLRSVRKVSKLIQH